jgi:hypothetical protein
VALDVLVTGHPRLLGAATTVAFDILIIDRAWLLRRHVVLLIGYSDSGSSVEPDHLAPTGRPESSVSDDAASVTKMTLAERQPRLTGRIG